jgi:hypothetical protein
MLTAAGKQFRQQAAAGGYDQGTVPMAYQSCCHVQGATFNAATLQSRQ